MLQRPAQVLAIAFWMLEHQPSPKSSTTILIDSLRERFDTEFIECLPSHLNLFDWHAQAILTVKFTQRCLAKHALELALIQADFAYGQAFIKAVYTLKAWLQVERSPLEERVALALLLRLFRRSSASIRDIAQFSGLSKSTLHRLEVCWRQAIVELRQRALTRLQQPMEKAGLLNLHEF